MSTPRLAARPNWLVPSCLLLLTACSPAQDSVRDAAVLELFPASPLVADLPAGQSRDFEVRLLPGSAGRVIAEQPGVDLALLLLGEDGSVAVKVDMPTGSQGVETLSLINPGTELHSFRLRIEHVEQEIRVPLSFEVLPALTPEHEARVRAESAYSQAQLHKKAQDHETAARDFRDAARAWGDAGDVRFQVYALQKTVEAVAKQRHYREALDLAREGYELAQAANLEQPQLALLNLQATQLKNLQAFDQANDLFRQVVERARAAKDLAMTAATLFNLGNLYRDSGQLESSLTFYGQAAEERRKAGQRSHYLQALQNKAEVLLDLQRCSDATTIVEFLRPEDRDHLEWLYIQGRIALCDPSGDEPPPIFETALRQCREQASHGGEIRILMQLAKWYQAMGRSADSLSALQEAHELSLPADASFPHVLTLLGRTLTRNGLPRRGLTLLQQAADTIGPDEALATSLHFAIAEAHLRLGDLVSALAQAEVALEEAETLRRKHMDPELRADYRSTKDHYYALVVELLMIHHAQDDSEGYDVRAWQIAESFKGRALLESLLEDPSHLHLDADPSTLAMRNLLRQRQSELNADLFHARREAANSPELRALEFEAQELSGRLRMIDSELSLQSPRLQQLEDPPHLDLENLRSDLLDDDTALLSYSLGDDGGYVWYVDRQTFRAMRLPSRDELETQVRELNRVWSRGGVPTDTYVQRLSRSLLGEFADLLQGQRLVISAAGPLHYLPFAALPNPGDVSRVLGQDHEIVYVPSISLLSVLRPDLATRPAAPEEILVAADPLFDLSDSRLPPHLRQPTSPAPANADLLRSLADMGRPSLHRLPATREEAEAIRALSPGKARVLLGFDASSERLQSLDLSQYNILHFATHGLYNDRNPDLSGLVLSQFDANGQPLEGFLSLRDIHEWQLNASLVVLSACETGLGRDIHGEGLQGLSQAFLYAGVPRLTVSLWQVNDEATRRLMEIFYSGLWQKGLEPAAALHAAQLELLQDGLPPSYWAGFIHLGEWR